MRLAYLIAIAIAFAWSAPIGCAVLAFAVACRRIVAAPLRLRVYRND